MREIKFRAWDGERMKQVNTLGFTDDAFVSTPKGCGPIEDYKITQYTGLKDRNGKAIYEGDIVKESDEWGDPDQLYEVEFGYNGFWLKNRDANEFGFGDPDEMEVIGNIYENPDLLNETA